MTDRACGCKLSSFPAQRGAPKGKTRGRTRRRLRDWGKGLTGRGKSSKKKEEKGSREVLSVYSGWVYTPVRKEMRPTGRGTEGGEKRRARGRDVCVMVKLCEEPDVEVGGARDHGTDDIQGNLYRIGPAIS